jgi:hypothetical protein
MSFIHRNPEKHSSQSKNIQKHIPFFIFSEKKVISKKKWSQIVTNNGEEFVRTPKEQS